MGRGARGRCEGRARAVLAQRRRRGERGTCGARSTARTKPDLPRGRAPARRGARGGGEAFATRVAELVEAAAAREPLGGLTRYARDRVEVAVVMEEGQGGALGDRGNNEIDGRRAAVLAPG